MWQKNTTSLNLIKKVFGKYNKFKKIPNILRSDQNISSLKNLKTLLKKSRLT
jgi:hypothetical protein